MDSRYYTDIIHGEIKLDPHLVDLISSWFPLKRLQKVAQLGVAQRVYPNARHTRFDHSLGTLGAARRLLREAGRGQGNWTDRINKKRFEIMALIHDIGHGPYSHVSESLLKRNPEWRPGGFDSHETFTELLIGRHSVWCKLCEDLYREDTVDWENMPIKEILEHVRNENKEVPSKIAGDVLELLDFQQDTKGLKSYELLHECFGKDEDGLPSSTEYGLISNEVDIDRMDYMLRDGYLTGLLSRDVIEKTWSDFATSLTLEYLRYETSTGDQRSISGFVLHDKALDALELFLYARHYHFRQIAYHPVTRLAELLWIHAAEGKLKEIRTEENDDRIVKLQLLKWFTQYGDGQFDEEFRDCPQTIEIEKLIGEKDVDLLKEGAKVCDWRVVACPFWALLPRDRIGLFDILDDKGKPGTTPGRVILEESVLRHLGLTEYAERAQAFVDFVIPPVDVPEVLVRVSQTDDIPLTSARERSGGLAALALGPFKEGQIVLYLARNVKEQCNRRRLGTAISNAIQILENEQGKLSILARKLERTLANGRKLTAANLGVMPDITEHYRGHPRLLGTKSSASSGQDSLNSHLEKDLDRLWVAGFLAKSVATYHPDDRGTVWANFLVKYELNKEQPEDQVPVPGSPRSPDDDKLYELLTDMEGEKPSENKDK